MQNLKILLFFVYQCFTYGTVQIISSDNYFIKLVILKIMLFWKTRMRSILRSRYNFNKKLKKSISFPKVKETHEEIHQKFVSNFIVCDKCTCIIQSIHFIQKKKKYIFFFFNWSAFPSFQQIKKTSGQQ